MGIKNKLLKVLSLTVLISASVYLLKTENHKIAKPALRYDALRSKAEKAFQYCKLKKMDTGICILVDMSLHSGINRCVVWDFQNDSVMKTMLLGHGCCDNNWSGDESKDNPRFSNRDGSHCSSLGRYKINSRGISNWGIRVKYLLHGLDSSNSNALARTIVLHSWEMMPEQEVYPEGSPEGWGCPTVSNSNMFYLDGLLKNRKKSVLLWIYK